MSIIDNKIKPYEETVNGINNDLLDIYNLLLSGYNFSLTPSDSSYENFWGEFINRTTIEEFGQISEIKDKANSLDILIKDRFNDIIGMVQQLDNLLCGTLDTYERCLDVIWSFKNGTLYTSQKDISGNYTKYGIKFFTDRIKEIYIEMRNDIEEVSNPNDSIKLQELRDKLFIKLDEISNLAVNIGFKLNQILDMLDDTKEMLEKTFPQAFKAFVIVSTTFSLSKKAETLQARVIGSPYYDDDVSKLIVNKAKHYKKQINEDYSNKSFCFEQACKESFEGLNIIQRMNTYKTNTFDVWVIKKMG